jgi:hypothetical protein
VQELRIVSAQPRLLLLLLLAPACTGGDAPSRGDLPEVSPARLGEHIRYLASDRLAGRGTGTAGYDSAARYVAKHFATLGLDSAGTEGYFQPVPLRRARAVEGSSLVLVGRAGRRTLAPYRDYVPYPDLVAPRSEVTAPLLFVGFGVTAPERGYDDYRRVDAKGKIVVLLTGAPASFPPAERAHYADRRAKRDNAVRRGAVGALVVRARDQTFPWDRLVRQSRLGEMRWLDLNGAPSDVWPSIHGAGVLSDSASLLEVARAFASLPEAPRRSVLFLAVTGEEAGLLGSDYFAEHPTVPIERIVADVNIDGLAIMYPLRDIIAFGAEHTTLDSTVARVGKRMGVTISPDPFPQEVFFVRSDQYSFVRRGVPSLFPFMGLRSDSGVDAPARFREWFATRYHLPQDDAGQPMDLASGARHAQLAFLVGLEIANAAKRPAWKAGDFFERTFGRKSAGAAASSH